MLSQLLLILLNQCILKLIKSLPTPSVSKRSKASLIYCFCSSVNSFLAFLVAFKGAFSFLNVDISLNLNIIEFLTENQNMKSLLKLKIYDCLYLFRIIWQIYFLKLINNILKRRTYYIIVFVFLLILVYEAIKIVKKRYIILSYLYIFYNFH